MLVASIDLAFGGEIHQAIREGKLKKLQALLKDNPDLISSRDDPSFGGGTPLHVAAYSGRKDVAEYLLANAAVVNARDDSGRTPLHSAAVDDEKDTAELLIANKADVNARDNAGETPLHAAAHGRNVAQLLLAHGAEVDARNSDFSSTPLHLAAVMNNRKVAELLIANKADINARDKNGQTPLHSAAYNGHKDFAQLLLANKPEINPLDNSGFTPLREAATQGFNNIVELLRANKADYDIFDAAAVGDLETVKALLKDKPESALSKSKLGLTPLHYASLTGRRRVAELLLANKADVNSTDDKGRTPLMLAVIRGDIPRARLTSDARQRDLGEQRAMAEFLLANKANVNARDKDAKTPLTLAKVMGRKETVELLIQHGGQE
jgi:ankyrin repeat protein